VLHSLFSALRRILQPSEPAMPSTVTISSATLDKDTYAAGDPMTLTVVRSASTTTERTDTLTVGATAGDASAPTVSASLTVTLTSPEASTVSVSDDSGRTWTQVSDDGATAVLTATA
jgi:hypothetical protein